MMIITMITGRHRRPPDHRDDPPVTGSREIDVGPWFRFAPLLDDKGEGSG